MGAVALAIVVVVLSAAAPASAATVGVEATGGTLGPGPDPWWIPPPFEFAPDEDPPCPPKPSTLTLATDVPAAGQWELSGTTSRFMQLGGSGPHYQIDHTVLGRGTYSGTTSPYSTATTGTTHLIVQTRIYMVDQDCDKDDLKCIVTTRVVGTGTYAGTLPATSPGDTMTLAGSSNRPGGIGFIAQQCSAPWVAMNGVQAYLNGFTVVVQ